MMSAVLSSISAFVLSQPLQSTFRKYYSTGLSTPSRDYSSRLTHSQNMKCLEICQKASSFPTCRYSICVSEYIVSYLFNFPSCPKDSETNCTFPAFKARKKHNSSSHTHIHTHTHTHTHTNALSHLSYLKDTERHWP